MSVSNAHVLMESALLINARQAAVLLGISLRTLWSMSVSGEIPSVKLRRRRLYDKRDLMRWIDAHKRRGL